MEVWQQNIIGGYYDFEGTDWLNPPLFNHDRSEVIDGRLYKLVDDGSHIHVIGWRSGNQLYWLTNTLLEELSNAQMIAIARTERPHGRTRQPGAPAQPREPGAGRLSRGSHGRAGSAACGRHHSAARGQPREPSSAAFTSASARAFWARGTVLMLQRSKPASAPMACWCSGRMSGCLTL